MFTRMFSEARRLYTVGDVDSSFLMYSLLAELGFEEAQSNVAYLLEQGTMPTQHVGSGGHPSGVEMRNWLFFFQ